MNRPIKFRAWDFDKKVFIPTNKWAVVQTSFSAFGMMLEDWENYLAGEFFYSNTQALMQFTGLHDKNGREIYEGDIVKCSSGCAHVMVYMNAVPSTNIGGMPGFYLTELNQGYAFTGKEEIIGNIYETPELIP